MKRWIVGSVLAVVAVMAFAWSRKSAPKEVPVVKAVRGPILSLITTNATAEPFEWRAVTATIAGRIGRVLVQAGDTTVWGQGVAEIEIPESRRDIAAAEAELDQTKAALATANQGGSAREKSEVDALESKLNIELASARREHAATARLVAKDAATKAELEVLADRIVQIESELKSAAVRRAVLVEFDARVAAASRYRLAQAAFDLVRNRQRSALLITPIPGVVYELNVKPGDWVEPGTAVAKVGNLETMRLKVYVDEPDLGRMSTGMKIKVSWDAIPDESWQATVERVPPQVTAMGTRMVGEVIARMPNPGMKIPTGSNLNAEIQAERVEAALTIPKESLRRKDSRIGVLVAENGTLRWRDVRIGISSLASVQVIDGLKEGDAVVAGSDPQFVEGMRATPVTGGVSR